MIFKVCLLHLKIDYFLNPPFKVIVENVQHYYDQRLYIFPVLQYLTHMLSSREVIEMLMIHEIVEGGSEQD